MSVLKRLAGVGVLVACPCHLLAFALMLGGTTLGAWFAAHLSPAMLVGSLVFAASLFILAVPNRVDGRGAAAACDSCATTPSSS
jgi:hypothetical protein